MLPSLPEGLRLLLAHIYPSPLRFLKPSFKKKKKHLITKAELYYFTLKYIIQTELYYL